MEIYVGERHAGDIGKICTLPVGYLKVPVSKPKLIQELEACSCGICGELKVWIWQP